MKSGIYCITNLVNGKVYVGQSVDIPKRWKTHRSNLRHGKGKHFHLGHAWAKYGEGNFLFTVLEYALVDQLDVLEEHYIRTLHATDSQFGYNVESKSRGRGIWTEEARTRLSDMRKGVKRSAETVAKMSEALKGRKCSPEAVEKMAASHRGLKWSDEARAKLSESRIGSKRSPESIAKGAASNRGKVLSDDTRSKISASKMGRKGRKMSPEAIAKSAASRRGRVVSDDTRAKLSAAAKGKVTSEETKAKLSAIGKGRPQSPEHKANIAKAKAAKKCDENAGQATNDVTPEVPRWAQQVHPLTI